MKIKKKNRGKGGGGVGWGVGSGGSEKRIEFFVNIQKNPGVRLGGIWGVNQE